MCLKSAVCHTSGWFQPQSDSPRGHGEEGWRPPVGRVLAVRASTAPFFPAGRVGVQRLRTIGIDPHTSSLTAVALQPDGEVSATIRLEVNRDTVARLRAWARPWPRGWCPTTAPACGPPARLPRWLTETRICGRLPCSSRCSSWARAARIRRSPRQLRVRRLRPACGPCRPARDRPAAVIELRRREESPDTPGGASNRPSNLARLRRSAPRSHDLDYRWDAGDSHHGLACVHRHRLDMTGRP